MMKMYYGFPLYGWILVIVLLMTQGIWLFLDARKHRANPWFWGLLGLLEFPWPTIFYLLIVRKVWRRFKVDK